MELFEQLQAFLSIVSNSQIVAVGQEFAQDARIKGRILDHKDLSFVVVVFHCLLRRRTAALPTIHAHPVERIKITCSATGELVADLEKG